MKLIWIIILITGVLFGYVIEHQYVKAETPLNIVNDNAINNNIIIPIVAVNGDNGIVGNATFTLISGTGRVLLDNDPMIDTDMQNTIIIATAYAKQYSGKSLNDNDLIIDFDMPDEVIGGVSSGAAVTIGTIALLEGKKLNESIIITGMISPDGIVRRVGEIREKAIAARDAGYKIFLVPIGQSRFRGQPYTLQEYLNNTIEIREVSTIAQAAEIMIMK